MFKKLSTILFSFLMFLSFDFFAQGCAMCKAAVESSEGGAGFNEAILYLMMFPYIIALGAIILFVVLLRKKKAA